MCVFVKVFILFFFNVIFCSIDPDEFKKSLEAIQTQVNLLSETDSKNISPFIEKLFSFLPKMEKTIKEMKDVKLVLEASLKREGFLMKNNQDLKTQNTDLSNQLINSQSKLQTAEKAIKEKDKKIKDFKSARSKLQKITYVTTIIAGIVVTYCIGRFYYDIYIN